MDRRKVAIYTDIEHNHIDTVLFFVSHVQPAGVRRVDRTVYAPDNYKSLRLCEIFYNGFVHALYNDIKILRLLVLA